MTTTKHIVRNDRWLDPVFDTRIKQEADCNVTIIANQGDEAAASAAFAQAHAYHVSAAKDELPKRLFVSAALLAGCPNLLCVSSSGAGYDTVNVADCTAAGVLVVNQAGGNAVSVAEMAMGLLLDVTRRISESNARLHTETGFSRESLMGREIHGKTIGIVGLGETGSRVAALARAFGMRVLALDPYLTSEAIAQRGAEAVPFNTLLERSDVVSLHCPRNQETMNLLNAAAYARMKKGAIVLSTARGGIHDEHALADAIASGHLGGAGLDVWHPEPPPLDHPLLKLPNVIATFHTAGVTHEARHNVAAIGAEQIVGVLRGGRPPRLINPEVWPAYATRFETIFGHKPA